MIWIDSDTIQMDRRCEQMGKNPFEKNGSHLSGYNAKIAEMRKNSARKNEDIKAEYLKKMQNLEQNEDASK